MKFLVLALCLVSAAYGRPGDLSGLSGSYLPSTGGSNTLSVISEPSGSYIPQGGSSIFSDLSGGGLDGGVSAAYNQYNGGSQDQRHVYFYAAPDDARLRINVVPSSQRNTKIIFVKAPSYGGVVPEVVAPPSQAEDKTLVFVLAKKPDQGGEITIPLSVGVKHIKPQVYYIKYRNQHEAQQAVQSGLNEQVVGSRLSDLGSEGSFARTLSTGVSSGLVSGGGVGGAYTGSSVLSATSGLSSLRGGISSLGVTTSVGGVSSLGGGISSLGVTTSGGASSLGDLSAVDSGTKYGAPGASGPYKR